MWLHSIPTFGFQLFLRDSVALAVVTANDFFNLVSFDSDIFVSVIFDSKFRDSVAFAEEIADDLVGVGLDFFPSNFLKMENYQLTWLRLD